MDSLIRLADGVWHREVDQGCWTRTAPGPVRIFNTPSEAESYAATVRPKPKAQAYRGTHSGDGQVTFIVAGDGVGVLAFLITNMQCREGRRVSVGLGRGQENIRSDTGILLPVNPRGLTTEVGQGPAVSLEGGLFGADTAPQLVIVNQGFSTNSGRLNGAVLLSLRGTVSPTVVNGSVSYALPAIAQFNETPCNTGTLTFSAPRVGDADALTRTVPTPAAGGQQLCIRTNDGRLVCSGP